MYSRYDGNAKISGNQEKVRSRANRHMYMVGVKEQIEEKAQLQIAIEGQGRFCCVEVLLC